MFQSPFQSQTIFNHYKLFTFMNWTTTHIPMFFPKQKENTHVSIPSKKKKKNILKHHPFPTRPHSTRLSDPQRPLAGDAVQRVLCHTARARRRAAAAGHSADGPLGPPRGNAVGWDKWWGNGGKMVGKMSELTKFKTWGTSSNRSLREMVALWWQKNIKDWELWGL